MVPRVGRYHLSGTGVSDALQRIRCTRRVTRHHEAGTGPFTTSQHHLLPPAVPQQRGTQVSTSTIMSPAETPAVAPDRAHVTLRRNGVGPVQIDCSLAVVRTGADGTVVSVPSGWEAVPLAGEPNAWRIMPLTVPLTDTVEVTLTAADGAQRAESLPIVLRLRSAFTPEHFAFLKRNRAADIGVVEPDRGLMQRTFRLLPGPLASIVFHGLYREIVFLRNGPRRGGLCSGMARWAIARWQGQEPPPADERQAVVRLQLFHGRQLRDRALLSALPWLLRGSSRAAYRAVRRDLLLSGASDRALDLAVPRLWRKDVFRAVVTEGHTVVPYALDQLSPEIGHVSVYDPNHPAALTNGNPRQITFDLQHDRYAYGTMATLDDNGLGMIAVQQRAYRAPGTAFITLLASTVWAPARSIIGITMQQVARIRTANATPAQPTS